MSVQSLCYEYNMQRTDILCEKNVETEVSKRVPLHFERLYRFYRPPPQPVTVSRAKESSHFHTSYKTTFRNISPYAWKANETHKNHHVF